MAVAIDTPAGGEMVAIKELKNSTHAPNLLMEIWAFIC